MSTLIRIKRLVLAKKVIFTVKAGNELERDGLLPLYVMEAIINAPAINKTLRSTNPRTGAREYLYVIIGQSYSGTVIYTKGTIRKKADEETYYILISSKRSIG
jgi:hypothetical protein